MKKLYFLAFMALSTLAFSQYIAKYDFNNNLNDLSGNGFNASANGTYFDYDRFGNGGYSLHFNGTSDYLNLGNLPLSGTDFSICFWTQRSNIDGNFHVIFSQGAVATDGGLHIGLTGTLGPDQNIGIDFMNDGLYDTTGANSTYWTHWFITFDHTNLNTNIYRNGQLTKAGALTGAYSGGGNVTVGMAAWGGNYFDGIIDDIFIFNKVYSAFQVDSLYQAETPCIPFTLSASTLNNATCNGVTDGSVTLTSTAGLQPFTYQWSNAQTSNPATGLGAGTYSCLVTDINGCKDSITVVISEPSVVMISFTPTNVTCNGGSNGALDALATGGVPPYLYSWAPINNSTSTLSNVPAGTYTCYVTDANGCNYYAYAGITEPGPFSAGISVSSGTVCQGQPDTLTASVSGGSAPYTYEWHDFTSGHTDTTLSNSFVIEPVSTGSTVAGVYVYDSMGCQTYTSGMFWTNMADSLSGTVTEPNSSPVTNAKVYLIKQKLSHVGLGDTLAAVPVDASGHFYAPDLFWGDYFMKVVADSATYPNSIPTYYSNKAYPFQWDSALVIQHHTCIGINDSGKNVTIIEITPPTGTGTISGMISSVNGYGQRYSSGGYSPMGAPLKGVDVKLGRNPGGSPAARTTTNSVTGMYTFTNVDTGSYKIYVDIPNYGMDSARVVEITSTDTISLKNDYYVDSSMVHVVPHYYITNAPSICSGDSVYAAGSYQHIAGTYYDSLLTTMGGDSVVVTDLTVNSLPNVTASASADTICLGGSVTLTAIGAVNYSWTGGVTNATPFSPTATDTYTVTGTDVHGCSDKTMVTVAVKSCVGINTYNRDGLSAYPNPATSILTVDASTIPLSIQIQNLAGEKVMDVAVTGLSTQVDIGKLAAGTYFAKVQLSKEGAKYLKIVKQ